jgi:Peptidase propeptide and YPEB domain
VLVIVGVFVLAFIVARGCQQSQVRFTEKQAIAIAERQVDFKPEQTQIRMLRQGLNSQPYWIVSLSIPGEREDTFRRLATVKINANTGKVEEVNRDI